MPPRWRSCYTLALRTTFLNLLSIDAKACSRRDQKALEPNRLPKLSAVAIISFFDPFQCSLHVQQLCLVPLQHPHFHRALLFRGGSIRRIRETRLGVIAERLCSLSEQAL